ncbi:MAG TPA: hypothetical protein VEJ21_03525, partial [Acidimicrobiales bacterium]|nr:hypothetical protein [Acidimicrobiales bacterium]
AAHSGVDLVEHHGRRRFGQHQAQRQHGPGQLAVRKDERRGRTRATVAAVEGQDRVVELARMLSGSPDSERARRHAEELLHGAAGAGTFHR